MESNRITLTYYVAVGAKSNTASPFAFATEEHARDYITGIVQDLTGASDGVVDRLVAASFRIIPVDVVLPEGVIEFDLDNAINMIRQARQRVA